MKKSTFGGKEDNFGHACILTHNYAYAHYGTDLRMRTNTADDDDADVKTPEVKSCKFIVKLCIKVETTIFRSGNISSLKNIF